MFIRMTGIDFINQIWKSVKTEEMPIMEFRAKQRSGKYVWMRCRGYLTRDECGIPVIFAGIMHKMDGQNKVDPLTQLFNHRMFMKRIRKYIEKVRKRKLQLLFWTWIISGRSMNFTAENSETGFYVQ